MIIACCRSRRPAVIAAAGGTARSDGALCIKIGQGAFRQGLPQAPAQVRRQREDCADEEHGIKLVQRRQRVQPRAPRLAARGRAGPAPSQHQGAEPVDRVAEGGAATDPRGGGVWAALRCGGRCRQAVCRRSVEVLCGLGDQVDQHLCCPLPQLGVRHLDDLQQGPCDRPLAVGRRSDARHARGASAGAARSGGREARGRTTRLDRVQQRPRRDRDDRVAIPQAAQGRRHDLLEPHLRRHRRGPRPDQGRQALQRGGADLEMLVRDTLQVDFGDGPDRDAAEDRAARNVRAMGGGGGGRLSNGQGPEASERLFPLRPVLVARLHLQDLLHLRSQAGPGRSRAGGGGGRRRRHRSN